MKYDEADKICYRCANAMFDTGGEEDDVWLCGCSKKQDFENKKNDLSECKFWKFGEGTVPSVY